MMEIVAYRLNLILKNRNFERGRFSCQRFYAWYITNPTVICIAQASQACRWSLAYLSEAAESVVQV